ncbi:MAG: hypothetical protein RB191_11005 [Terriglobia bacterium]|nr:hypothetical protein [Terriglobia bacterium]
MPSVGSFALLLALVLAMYDLVLWAGGKRRLATDFLQQSTSKKLESVEFLGAGEESSSISLVLRHS